MRKLSRLSWLGVSAGSLAAGLASPALAQDGATAAQDNSDIIVTARRVEERLQDVPISISVVSQSQLTDRNITNASQLSFYVPSLSTDQRYGGDTTTFNIRGFFQENVSTPTVGVYFADAIQPRGNSVTNTPSGDGVGAGNLFDLQNVQVLKGPQGTLFGRNTTGGVVLLVPTKPTSRLEGYVEGSVGNYGLDREQGVLNAPLASWARLRLGFDRQQRDGWQRNISGIGPRRFAESDYYALRASLVLDVTPDIENYTIGTFARSNPTPAINSIVACNNDTPASPAGLQALVQAFGFCNAYQARRAAGGFYSVQNSLDQPIRQYNRQWQVINTTTWKASDDLTVKNIFAYAQFKANFRSTIFGENYIVDPATVPDTVQGSAALAASIRGIAAAAAGGRFLIANSSFGPTGPSASQSTLSEELQIQGRAFDGKLNMQGGLYLERSDPIRQSASSPISSVACTDSSFTPACNDLYRSYLLPTLVNLGAAPAITPVGFLPPIGKVSDNRTEIHYRDYGIYAQGTYAITDQFKVTGGLRYSWDKMFSDSSVLDFVGFPVGATYGPPGSLPLSVFTPPATITQAPTMRCLFADANIANGCFRKNSSLTKKPTGLIDLEYTPTSDMLIYAKYSRGYRQGGIQPRSPIDNYDAETIDAYEAGTKLSFRGGGLTGTFNLAAFYNKLKNQQLQASFSIDNVFFQSLLNVGKSDVYGLEVDSSLRYDIFHLDVSGSYLHTKITDAPSQVGLVPLIRQAVGPGPDIVISTFPNKGDPLPLAPKFRIVVTPAIDIPVPDSLGKLSLSGTMVYTSKSFVTSADGYDGPHSKQNYNEPVTLFNANLNWRSVANSPFDLSLFVTNLTGNKYNVAFLGGYSNSVGSETGRQGEPRMYGARLRYRFGAAAR